jgi:hypothetical protein
MRVREPSSRNLRISLVAVVAQIALSLLLREYITLVGLIQ